MSTEQNPYASPNQDAWGVPAPAVDGGIFDDHQREVLAKFAANLKFVGLWFCILGAIYCITIYGIFAGAIFIALGLEARKAGKFFRLVGLTEVDDRQGLMMGIERLYQISRSLYAVIWLMIILFGVVLLAIGVAAATGELLP